MMNSKDKIERIVARNPELKSTLKKLEDPGIREQLRKISTQDHKKLVIVGRNSDSIARLYELSYIINTGYPHITEVTTLDLLDMYTNRSNDLSDEQPSLSSVVDDLVLIHDSRAYLPNKQKTNMVMQVLEQNERCIYYYKGSHKSFLEEHSPLLDYLKDNGIIKLNTDSNKQAYDGTRSEISKKRWSDEQAPSHIDSTLDEI